MSKLLAVGTVAFDAIETPFGKTDKILGGSGTFVGLAASQFGVANGSGFCCWWRFSCSLFRNDECERNQYRWN